MPDLRLGNDHAIEVRHWDRDVLRSLPPTALALIAEDAGVDPAAENDDGEPLYPDLIEAVATRVVRNPLPGQRVTSVGIPNENDPSTWMHDLFGASGLWRSHSDGDPAWVDGDERLAGAVAAVFGIPIGEPAGWGEEADDEG